MLERVVIAGIRLYQKGISPLLPPSCRFVPTCSVYAAECVERFGAGRGLWMAARRILRCHPFGGHGFDPVPAGRSPAVASGHDPDAAAPEPPQTRNDA